MEALYKPDNLMKQMTRRVTSVDWRSLRNFFAHAEDPRRSVDTDSSYKDPMEQADREETSTGGQTKRRTEPGTSTSTNSTSLNLSPCQGGHMLEELEVKQTR
jgi:hypothetical protein